MVLRDTAVTYEEELKKNPELKESDVQMLREWCAKQPHLPKISDVELAQFLYYNKFRVEPTKTNIETYYTMRTHAPEIFSNRDPVESKNLRMAFKTFACYIMDKLTDDGYNIVYAKLVVTDPSYCYYDYCLTYASMIVDLWRHTEGTYRGLVIVYNVQPFMLSQLCHTNFMILKKFLLYIQGANPIRLGGVHLTVSPPAVYVFVKMLQPLIKKKLLDKIHFHTTAETLQKFIPLDALPNEDGGKAGNLADLAAETVKWLENNRAWFQNDEATMRVNELLRPGKAKTSTDLFGAEGSFKKLEID